MPQLRQNIITGEWVVIAPERAKRPSDFIAAEALKPGLPTECPFCHDSQNYKKNRLKDFETAGVYVIPNSYPAFVEDEGHCSPRTLKAESGFYNFRPASGGHDVIIVKEHAHQLFDFSQETWHDLFTVTKRRYNYWRRDCNTRYSMMIYNQGVKAGASIYHPHAQLMASNVIPNQVSKEIHGAQAYFEENGTCVFCDLIEHEKQEKIRVVEENDHFIAFTFYAARFPFEIWVLPKNHGSHFASQTSEMLGSLAKIMDKTTKRLGTTLQKPSLNFFIHDSPTTVEKADYFHWHLEITPRVSTYGGYELGSGIIIDIMSPEDAAKYLLKARKGSRS